MNRIAVIALAAGAALVSIVHAEDAVVVTPTRFPQSLRKTPSNIVVITAEDIRNSPAMNLPDILKTTAGIDVRPLYGSMGIDATVDLRGFGDAAASNTLILLDGQRLNPIDSGFISWSTIAPGSIQRIEIIPGAGTVSFGDQASGGVINIITDKSGKSQASATATVGSFGYRGVDARGSGGSETGYASLAAHYADSEGWRRNSRMNQQAVSGSAGRYFAGGKGFLDYALYKDASGLPGSLLSAAYRSDPTSTRTPSDSQNRDGYRIRPGFSYALSGNVSMDAELSVVHEDFHGENVSFSGTYDRARDTWSLTPRLRWQHGSGRLKGVTVIGVDYYDGKVETRTDGAAFLTPEAQGASQKSTALYAQNSTDLGENWVLSAGARSQRMEQRASQGAYVTDFGFGPYATPALDGVAVRTRNAYDLGLIYNADGWRAYGKTGTTFRFANTDELFGFDSDTGRPIFAGDLRPQHGTVREIGASFDNGRVSGKVAVHQLDLNDEIGFDGVTFANVNFASTRRSGLEAELDWRPAATVKARLSYAYVDAHFRDGAYAGKEIPLVSRNKASARLVWQGGALGTYSVFANFVGARRYSGDSTNVRDMLAGYATMDFQGSWDIKSWTISARLLNLFDRRYAPYAGYSTFRSDYYYYPADARSLFVSARYAFR